MKIRGHRPAARVRHLHFRCTLIGSFGKSSAMHDFGGHDRIDASRDSGGSSGSNLQIVALTDLGARPVQKLALFEITDLLSARRKQDGS